jgi:hypothetical protein
MEMVDLIFLFFNKSRLLDQLVRKKKKVGHLVFSFLKESLWLE